MNKSLKRLMVTGASLLMLASIGISINQSASSVHAMSKGGRYPAITTQKEYREVKHAKGVPYSDVGLHRIKHLPAWGDNETVGYVYGHKVLFGTNGGMILKIDGHRATYGRAKAVFHEYTHKRHVRKRIRRIRRRMNRRHARKHVTKRVHRHGRRNRR